MKDHENPKLPKGGRGKKAPYETQTVRVPLPCLESVQSIMDEFRTTGRSPKIGNDLIDKNEATRIAQEIYTSRIGRTKSAKQSLEKLLECIYGEEVIL
jgi:hypothetical protein